MVNIVSFDWLEDSLIKMHPCNEREYLMSINGKAQKEKKKMKKAVREDNIKKGCESCRGPEAIRLVYPKVHSNWRYSGSIRKGVQRI